MPQSPPSPETDLTYSVLACKLTSTHDTEAATLAMKVYPNPTTDLLGLAFNLEQEAEVGIEIIDVQGKILKLKQQKFSSGRSTTSIYISDLPSGIYLCRLVTSDITASKKFVKQ